jgi:class 3 adenylate cyclase
MFGDITGSTAWMRRSSPEDVSALMAPVYAEFEKIREDKDLFVKFLGDGFMVVRHLKQNHDHKIICEVFKKMMGVVNRI